MRITVLKRFSLPVPPFFSQWRVQVMWRREKSSLVQSNAPSGEEEVVVVVHVSMNLSKQKQCMLFFGNISLEPSPPSSRRAHLSECGRHLKPSPPPRRTRPFPHLIKWNSKGRGLPSDLNFWRWTQIAIDDALPTDWTDQRWHRRFFVVVIHPLYWCCFRHHPSSLPSSWHWTCCFVIVVTYGLVPIPNIPRKIP